MEATFSHVQTSSNAELTRPLSDRNRSIQYVNAEGTVGERAYPINYEELYNLKGRLLTIIDATFTDPQQRKAQKDIFWQALQGWMNDIERAAGLEPYSGLRAGDEPHGFDET